ncbi:MAG: hypothetical protein N3C12_14160 [Candidatus Binatia bacterium]|nr:hypothetical protein [Candidatus Binatia bacterium]
MVNVVAVEGRSHEPGATDIVDVCVNLEVNSGHVAGVQADLLWDPVCLSAEAPVGDEVKCGLGAGVDRDTFMVRLVEPARMRALMVSLRDTRPLPAEVNRLFCCVFRTAGGAAHCEVDLDNLILSDPRGRRLPVELRPGTVEANG